ALAEHPLVGQVRGVGMLGALELVQDKRTRERFPGKGAAGTLCRDLCIRNGLVMRAVGDTPIMSPPLAIQPQEIDELFDKAWRTLIMVAEELRGLGSVPLSARTQLEYTRRWRTSVCKEGSQ